MLSALIRSRHAALQDRTVPCLTVLLLRNMDGQERCLPAVLQEVRLSRSSNTSAASSGCKSLFQSTYMAYLECNYFPCYACKEELPISEECREERRKEGVSWGIWGTSSRCLFTTPFNTMVWLQAPPQLGKSEVFFHSLKATVVSVCHNFLINCSLPNCLSNLTSMLVAACRFSKVFPRPF